jgi:hypothetical protein
MHQTVVTIWKTVIIMNPVNDMASLLFKIPRIPPVLVTGFRLPHTVGKDRTVFLIHVAPVEVLLLRISSIGDFARRPRPVQSVLRGLSDLAKSLPRKPGNILYSYWLMVRPGGRCRPSKHCGAGLFE